MTFTRRASATAPATWRTYETPRVSVAAGGRLCRRERGDRRCAHGRRHVRGPAVDRAHADVNAAQPDGATPLHWAVYRSDRETVSLLLAAGANPKAANREGSTPLWLASINGDAATLKALLKAGADPNEHLP
jgi:hypothetical protein